MASGSYSFTVGREYDGMTARSFLRRVCGLTARSMTVLKLHENGLTCGGALLRSCDIVREGDRIDLQLPEETCGIEPVKGELNVLYEDDCLLVVDKPAQMPVHPTKVHQTDTLASIVAWYQQQRGESYVFRALNRLDKDTSGCVLIAKDRLTYALVQPTVTKQYIAVCEGVILGSGVIDAPITLAADSKIKRCVSSEGKRAVTQYNPLRHSADHTMLRLTLLTGRTHQIRCHMSSIGHPLAGDDLYGGSRDRISRQALHCERITFQHPITKELIELHAPIPPEFYGIMDDPAAT